MGQGRHRQGARQCASRPAPLPLLGASTSTTLYVAFGFALLVDAHGSPASWMPMLAYAVPIGVICGGVALVGVLLLGVGKRLGRLTHGALSRLGGRHLGLLLPQILMMPRADDSIKRRLEQT